MKCEKCSAKKDVVDMDIERLGGGMRRPHLWAKYKYLCVSCIQKIKNEGTK